MSERVRDAERVLAEAGFPGRVTACGHDGSVAAVAVPPDAWRQLAGPAGQGVVARIRAAGFRYVALELEPRPRPDA